MRTRFPAILAWLCIGHAVLAGLYGLLLVIPESNVWMLAASTATVLAALCAAGVVEMTASLAVEPAASWRTAVRTAIRRAWLVALPLALFAAIWWLTGAAADWQARNSGQADAWIIANTGWTRTAWLHRGLAWVLAFVRYGAGASLAAALLAALSRGGIRAVVSPWMRRGLGWRPLLVTSLALVLGLWLPWQAAYWRPEALPSTWVQPAFAAVKLLALYVAANLAWAVVLGTASRQP